jgi:hypothetical protein
LTDTSRRNLLPGRDRRINCGPGAPTRETERSDGRASGLVLPLARGARSRLRLRSCGSGHRMRFALLARAGATMRGVYQKGVEEWPSGGVAQRRSSAPVSPSGRRTGGTPCAMIARPRLERQCPLRPCHPNHIPKVLSDQYLGFFDRTLFGHSLDGADPYSILTECAFRPITQKGLRRVVRPNLGVRASVVSSLRHWRNGRVRC